MAAKYAGYALECLRLAERAEDPAKKALMLDMAQAWIRLSEQAKEKASADSGASGQ